MLQGKSIEKPVVTESKEETEGLSREREEMMIMTLNGDYDGHDNDRDEKMRIRMMLMMENDDIKTTLFFWPFFLLASPFNIYFSPFLDIFTVERLHFALKIHPHLHHHHHSSGKKCVFNAF